MEREQLLDGERDLRVEWLVALGNRVQGSWDAVLDLLPTGLGTCRVRGDEVALVTDGVGSSRVRLPPADLVGREHPRRQVHPAAEQRARSDVLLVGSLWYVDHAVSAALRFGPILSGAKVPPAERVGG